MSFQCLVEETVSGEFHEDAHDLLNELLKEISNKVDAGLLVKFTPREKSLSSSSVKLNFGLELGKPKMIKDVSEFSTIQLKVNQ